LNYYPFHIGDYASATRHLSWDEDCAYRRLLDAYYTTEKPLPLEQRSVCRLVLATTEDQRQAVMTVLSEFWERTEAGWVNRRADVEIAAMREKQQKQRDKANKRWLMPGSEPGTASAMPRHPTTDATASIFDADAMPPTPTPTPTPTPKNPSGSEPVKPARKTKGSRRVPEDFTVTDEMAEWAQEGAPLVDWRRETEKFRDWEFKHPRSDWPATWRTWMRKAQEDAESRRPAGNRTPSGVAL
jgi:uncharacterized protein YdaU (DUF1376 family)